MANWQDWVGRTETRHDVLTPGLIARHRATLDRPSGDTPLPGIHWCLCLPDAPMAQLGEDGHPRRAGLPTGEADNGRDMAGSFMPPIPLPRRMWASSSVHFHAPLHAGAEIERTSTIASISEKVGSTGPLAFVDVHHQSYADGVLVVRETQTIVYRDASTMPPSIAAPRAGAAVIEADDTLAVARLTPCPALLLRFSALTFNAHRIHYDLPYAREVEGYAGLVVHGPLTASLLLNFATECFGPLAQFNFRGLAPAFAGEVMTLTARRDDGTVSMVALGPTGDTAMKAEAVLA